MAQRAEEALNWESVTWVLVLKLTWALSLHPVPERFTGKISFHSLLEASSIIMLLYFISFLDFLSTLLYG